jgi:hypothetical protein
MLPEYPRVIISIKHEMTGDMQSPPTGVLSNPRTWILKFRSVFLLLPLLIPFPLLAGHGIAAANIKVVENNVSNETNSVTVTTTFSINDFRIRAGSTRGDYNVQIGSSAMDDAATGVLMSCVAENGRDNGETASPGANFCTSTIDRATDGGYYISTFNSPAGKEWNINVAAAFFDYSKWLGGHARNSGDTNGGANNLLTASPGLALGTHFIENGGGVFTVDMRSRGINSTNDGVLLVTGGKNEDNYALSQANANGTWSIYVKDNGSDKDEYEQDPVAFVFIPRTNTSVVCGKFLGDGTPVIYSGSAPSYNVTSNAAGIWRLRINGQSPSTGVLILCAEGGLSYNSDNIVSYQPDGDSWLIQSRDLAPDRAPSLQTPPVPQPVASFVFIPAATVSLASPTNENVRGAATLSVKTADAAPGSLTVTFYGRETPMPFPGPDFTVVVLPDTQYYANEANGGTKEMWIAQTEWTITNRLEQNVAYLAHMGDISNNGDSTLSQWQNATNAMYRLEDESRTTLAGGIPYGLAVGNHDLTPRGDPTGTSAYFNRYFGVSHFSGRSYYGGHSGTNNNNHFDLFSASGLDFIVLYFEYCDGGDTNAIAWAQQVLATNQTRRVIGVTHYMGSPKEPSTHSAQGAAIYSALKSNTNLFLLLGGHVTGEGYRSDTFNGNITRTFIQDYQSWTNGGNGWMRLFEFSPSNNTVVVQTHNPWTGEWIPESEKYFSYNMALPTGSGSTGTPYSALGAATAFPGGVASVQWRGLAPGKTYDWYVTITDAAGNSSASGPWSFITGQNSAPVAANQLFQIPADQSSTLHLTASDPDGDPIVYRLNTVPSRGLVSTFDTNSGSFTYTPARGFRGADLLRFSVDDGMTNSANATANLVVLAPSDTNADGLPDSWAAAYGLSGANADPDGDGESNLAEYMAGTNPTNSASVFRIISATRSGNACDLSWSSVGGVRYRVQYTDSPGANAPFKDVVRSLAVEMDANPPGVPGIQTYVDDHTLTGPATNSARYYRVRVAQ